MELFYRIFSIIFGIMVLLVGFGVAPDLDQSGISMCLYLCVAMSFNNAANGENRN
jgi:hypothetical protein